MPSKTKSKYSREETLAWSREGEPYPSILAWDDLQRSEPLKLGNERLVFFVRAIAANRPLDTLRRPDRSPPGARGLAVDVQLDAL
jgi:hypothetical protein